MSVSEQQLLERERELGRIVSIEDELARERGHRPEWSYGEDGGDLTASCECGVCGVRMACRVFADGRVWTAGRLRVTRECVTPA